MKEEASEDKNWSFEAIRWQIFLQSPQHAMTIIDIYYIVLPDDYKRKCKEPKDLYFNPS